MSSEVSFDRTRTNQDLITLQEQYQRKRQDIIQKNEAQLRELEKSFADKQDELHRSGAASVNHLRKLNQEQIDQLRKNQEERLTYEAKNLHQRYNDLKENNEKTLHELQEEIDSSRFHANQQKLLVEQNHDKELGQIETDHKQKIENLKDEQAVNWKKTKSDGQLKLEELKKDQQQKYEKDRQQSQQSLNRLHDQYREEQFNLKDTSEKKIHDFRQQIEQDQLNTRLTEEKNLSTMHQYYQDEASRLHKEGDEVIAQGKIQQQQLKTEQKKSHTEEMKKLQQQQDIERLKSAQSHKSHMQKNQLVYRQELKEQQEEFQEAFQKNQKFNEDTLDHQHTQLVNEMIQQKQALLQSVGRYQNRKDDPFYRSQAPSTQLKETDHFYIIETQVPEHEKDSIDIRIKNDKAIISGRRSFSDEIKTEDRKFNTHSYQTFREEIPLSQPVVEKLVEKSWEDGKLTVKVAKIGSSIGSSTRS